MVTQILTPEEIEKFRQRVAKKRFAAFNQWIRTLGYKDRLPRGKYFIGKTPRRIVLDEFWMANSK